MPNRHRGARSAAAPRHTDSYGRGLMGAGLGDASLTYFCFAYAR